MVLGPGPSSLAHLSRARGTLAGYGVDLEVALGTSATDGRVELPLSLTVGAWLVRDALGTDSRSVGCSVGPDDPAGRSGDLIKVAAGVDTVLIVMGDGSARRSSAAPGYLDDRAEIFDTQVAAALRGGDSVALSAIDAQIGAELLAAGVPAWHAAAVLLQGRQHDAQLLYADAPYGVGYFVAAWTAGG